MLSRINTVHEYFSGVYYVCINKANGNEPRALQINATHVMICVAFQEEQWFSLEAWMYLCSPLLKVNLKRYINETMEHKTLTNSALEIFSESRGL